LNQPSLYDGHHDLFLEDFQDYLFNLSSTFPFGLKSVVDTKIGDIFGYARGQNRESPLQGDLYSPAFVLSGFAIR
jgi:hypothetical protein